MIRRLSPDARKPTKRAAAEDEASVLAATEPTTITHRRGQTKFLAPGEEEASGVSKMGRAAAKLCRLAFELAKAPDVAAMAELALAGLAEGTQTDAGALLLLPANVQGRAARRRPGNRRLPQLLGTSLPPRLELSGLDRAARGRSGAGAQRDGRQHLGHPRQPGRNPRHQRDLRPGPPRRPGVRTDPPLFHRPVDRARPRRPRVHPGGGRHRGRGHGKHPPPAGIGREPHSRAHRKRRTARAAGHPQRDHRPQHGDSPGDRGDRAAPPPATPPC